jgi:hypothetical protein
VGIVEKQARPLHGALAINWFDLQGGAVEFDNGPNFRHKVIVQEKDDDHYTVRWAKLA